MLNGGYSSDGDGICRGWVQLITRMVIMVMKMEVQVVVVVVMN